MIHLELKHPDFGFTASDQQGNSMEMDIPVSQGGHDKGLRPMQTLLAALGGCSGVDVVNILLKQHQGIDTFHISVDGEREGNVEPSLWKSIQIHYELLGSIEPSKALRAVELSMQKYCSVAETLRRAGAEIVWTIRVNWKLVH